jgi:hypothetical protein
MNDSPSVSYLAAGVSTKNGISINVSGVIIAGPGISPRENYPIGRGGTSKPWHGCVLYRSRALFDGSLGLDFLADVGSPTQSHPSSDELGRQLTNGLNYRCTDRPLEGYAADKGIDAYLLPPFLLGAKIIKR